MSDIIYFDNAATTYPKPESVIMSTVDCMKNYCGNPGRGSHPIAMKSAEKVFEAREAVAEMFGASVAEETIVQYGGSMNDKNAAELLSKENVDGGLIGGASLKSAAFAAIVDAAQ